MPKFKFKPDKHEPGCSSNGTRAENAERTMCAEGCAYDLSNDTLEAGIGDLMADLLHLCDREGIDGEAMLKRVEMNWQAER
jgi:hypothetical protein